MNASCRFHDYRERLHPDQELIIFRVIQELINNILNIVIPALSILLKTLAVTNCISECIMMAGDLTQADFEKLNKSTVGSWIEKYPEPAKLLHGRIFFEKDMSQTYYKVTIEVPKIEDGAPVKGIKNVFSLYVTRLK